MLKLVTLAAIVVVISARPNLNIGTQNVVTVPPNCPPGQEWINGQCREVWRRDKSEFNQKNVINVPPNCPPGQQLINGNCRDVWKLIKNYEIKKNNVINVSPDCPAGQQSINGQCRDIWKLQNIDLTNVVTVPPNCPEGQELINDKCRDIWKRQSSVSKITVVTPNCQEGQEYISGECRDVWFAQNAFNTDFMQTESELANLLESLLESLQSQRITRSADEGKAGIQNRNIISVPNQCPNGHRPDALGICRPVFDTSL
ncbi:hypothetical protein O0L34_g7048 [Tuta absoluta]|nr:hypothetical protein O0L34_g7048 [Tuta absoluta]